MIKKQSGVKGAIGNFFRTTTLHGFKYLVSDFYVDRIGWVVCCLASACCAGVLCAVLWARFLEVPALLALSDLRAGFTLQQRMPLVAVCPPAESIADFFVGNLTTDVKLKKRLTRTVARVLSGKPGAKDQLQLLDQFLIANNVTLPEIMYTYMPSCRMLTKMCRWQDVMVPCEDLFEKELTPWGICCTMRAEKLMTLTTKSTGRFDTTKRLDLALQCSNKSTYGCEFITKFDDEEWQQPMVLAPGYNYIAQLRFTSVSQSTTEELVESTCVLDKNYSRGECLEKCAEQSCGCSDPLSMSKSELDTQASCTITQLSCIRSHWYHNNISCNCLPSCNKVTTYITLESSPMNAINYTFDPIYNGLNATSSLVIYIRLNLGLSRIFTLNPTETWLTLLSFAVDTLITLSFCYLKISPKHYTYTLPAMVTTTDYLLNKKAASLGGVFNMFLGVGLFSALEFMFLLFVKLPNAIRKSSEIDNPSVLGH